MPASVYTVYGERNADSKKLYRIAYVYSEGQQSHNGSICNMKNIVIQVQELRNCKSSIFFKLEITNKTI